MYFIILKTARSVGDLPENLPGGLPRDPDGGFLNGGLLTGHSSRSLKEISCKFCYNSLCTA